MSSGFISEADLVQRRKVQLDLWQQTRKDDDPLEPPDEVLMRNRSLFDQLQEQKNKKEEEWEEAHKLKNMVRGLEDDEVDFLELVDSSKLQEEKRIKSEDQQALNEYRKRVAEKQKEVSNLETAREIQPEIRKLAQIKKCSQSQLLSGAIKRKASPDSKAIKKVKSADSSTASMAHSSGSKTEISSHSQNFISKQSINIAVDKNSDTNSSHTKVANITTNSNTISNTTQYIFTQPPQLQSGLHCIAVLPGMGVYDDTSDSNSDNSDSDVEYCNHGTPRDLTGRTVKMSSKESNSK